MFQRTLRLYYNAYTGLPPSVWLLAGVMLINRCGTMVLPFLTLYLTQHLHYNVEQAGVIMALFGVGAFCGTFLGGRLTDRVGFYYVQLISLLFGGLALLGLQFVTNFSALCFSVFGFTLFGDAFRPANQAAIAHYAEPDVRTRAFSLNRLAINLGWSVGGGVGGLLASINYSLLFWADGLTCLLAGAVLWTFLPVPRVQSAPVSSIIATLPVEPLTPRTPYRDGRFIGFVLCNTLYFTVFMQLFSIVPLYFKEVVHLSEATIGGLMTLNGLLIVFIEMALVYSIEQRGLNKLRLVASGALVSALAYGLMLTVNSSVSNLAVVYILLITLSEMLAMPFMQSFVIERASPTTRGQYLALYGMGGAIAQTAAPALGSQVVGHFGFSANWLMLISISLVAASGFWWMGRKSAQG